METSRSLPSHHPTILLAGGDDIDPALATELPHAGLIIAADSGLDHAPKLGLQADVVIGDMDSVDPTVLEQAEAAGTTILRYPIDKDATDLDLALSYAADHGVEQVVVVGGHGGRFDHLVANVLLLTSERYRQLEISWWFDRSRIAVVRPRHPVHWETGLDELVTLLAVGTPARGVTTSGLRWPLAGDDLELGSTRGVSNIITSLPASVSIESGILIAIRERNAP